MNFVFTLLVFDGTDLAPKEDQTIKVSIDKNSEWNMTGPLLFVDDGYKNTSLLVIRLYEDKPSHPVSMACRTPLEDNITLEISHVSSSEEGEFGLLVNSERVVLPFNVTMTISLDQNDAFCIYQTVISPYDKYIFVVQYDQTYQALITIFGIVLACILLVVIIRFITPIYLRICYSKVSHEGNEDLSPMVPPSGIEKS